MKSKRGPARSPEEKQHFRVALRSASISIVVLCGWAIAEEPPRVQLVTRVVDPAGNPISGASVRVLTLTAEAQALDLDRLSRKHNETREVRFANDMRMTTDGMGRFSSPEAL